MENKYSHLLKSKIALLGVGKTGGRILELFPNEQIIVFSSKNPPSLEALEDCSLIISFLPGVIFKEYLNLLKESKLPVVTGSTGFDWPSGWSQGLRKDGLLWVQGHNFSLGMNLVFQMIQSLKKVNSLTDNFNFSLHEIHHSHKKDAPSGTALGWQRWLGHPVDISSERIGDVVGDHQLTLNMGNEKITLRHEALDRKIFADGALWAANYLLANQKKLKPGLHHFEDWARSLVIPEMDKK